MLHFYYVIEKNTQRHELNDHKKNLKILDINTYSNWTLKERSMTWTEQNNSFVFYTTIKKDNN